MTVDEFEALRPLLTRHAYRMLGSWSDAEDVVQDAYVRWYGDGTGRSNVREPRAFLRTTGDASRARPVAFRARAA